MLIWGTREKASRPPRANRCFASRPPVEKTVASAASRATRLRRRRPIHSHALWLALAALTPIFHPNNLLLQAPTPLLFLSSSPSNELVTCLSFILLGQKHWKRSECCVCGNTGLVKIRGLTWVRFGFFFFDLPAPKWPLLLNPRMWSRSQRT